MDIVNACCGMKQAELASKAQFAVAKKLLDSQAQVGASMLKLLQAASGGIANAGDELVAAATGLGGSVDTYG